MNYPELIHFKTIKEPRGVLSFLEGAKHVPFEVRRVYWLTEIPEEQQRGGHAHKTGEQVIVSLQGIVEVQLERQSGECLNYKLDSPDKGLYIPPMWWGKMVFKENAILSGLASDDSSESDYIRDKKDF